MSWASLSLSRSGWSSRSVSLWILATMSAAGPATFTSKVLVSAGSRAVTVSMLLSMMAASSPVARRIARLSCGGSRAPPHGLGPGTGQFLGHHEIHGNAGSGLPGAGLVARRVEDEAGGRHGFLD